MTENRTGKGKAQNVKLEEAEILAKILSFLNSF